MDILLNFLVMFVIIFLFYKLKESANPFIYIGVLVISLMSFVVTLNDDLYLTYGTTQEINIINTTNIISNSTLQVIDLNSYNFVFQAFYLMAFASIIIYWTLGRNINPEEKI